MKSGSFHILTPEQLGERIRQIREAKGMSQEDLASLISRDQRAVSLYESGQRRIYAHDIPRIAQALEVPLSYLYEEFSTDDDLDSALLQQFHRIDTKKRKKVIEIMRLFSDTLVDADD